MVCHNIHVVGKLMTFLACFFFLFPDNFLVSSHCSGGVMIEVNTVISSPHVCCLLLAGAARSLVISLLWSRLQ